MVGMGLEIAADTLPRVRMATLRHPPGGRESCREARRVLYQETSLRDFDFHDWRDVRAYEAGVAHLTPEQELHPQAMHKNR